MKLSGQRLDSSGLYYYGARYYDPQIGRFISADTVVQDLANPQTLNRYSYCLNNPLKYIDPTGYYGETLGTPYIESGALGWTSSEGYLMSVGGQWLPVKGETVDFMTSAYQSSSYNRWSEFVYGFVRSLEAVLGNNQGQPYTAKSIEDYMQSVPFFKLGDKTYFWTLENRYDREKELSGQWPCDLQLALMPYDVMTTHDFIIFCDAVTFLGDIPIFGPPGWIVSAASGTTSYFLTRSEYKMGNITQNDMMRAHINWSIGLIPLPYVGLFPAVAQLRFDWSSR